MNTSEPDFLGPQAPGLQVEVGAKATRRFRAVCFMSLAVCLGIIAAATIWLHGQTGPTITWSQPTILEFLVPGQNKTLAMTFRSNQTLSNLSVFVTPSLSSLVTGTPATFSTIVANQAYQLSLRLQAGAQSEVKFDGTVQIKSAAPGSSATYAQPLPMTIVIHKVPVPPDPGP